LRHDAALAETFSPLSEPERQVRPELELLQGGGESADSPVMQPDLYAVLDPLPETSVVTEPTEAIETATTLRPAPPIEEGDAVELPPWRRQAAVEAGRRTVSLAAPKTVSKSPGRYESSKSGDDSEILSYKSSSGSAWLVKWALLKQWAKTGKTEAEDRGEVHNEFTCGCMYCTVIRWS